MYPLFGMFAIAVATLSPASLPTEATEFVVRIDGATTSEEVTIEVPSPQLGDTRILLDEIMRALQEETLPSVNNEQRSTFSNIIDYAFSRDEALLVLPSSPQLIPSACPLFVQDFEIGDTHSEIQEIQRFLNQEVATQVAQNGAGAPGAETEFFGTRTFNAVFAFQARYADDVLTPLGLTSPTGYWGPSTRKKANELSGCST